ncbi:MAG: inorganic pyrophosphatase [Ignavibacteriae bacterium]|nr:inorganic pyrophosphatase [Ignavibacteriota bacterium]MCB0753762.1 inorganic pyrophosphatase [Ignavibacteriota bacterium]
MSFPSPFFKWRPHPWHGLELGKNPPSVVSAYIEITPFDFVKYEVDKKTGYLKVDRPHRTSSQPPSLYGFIPKTYCGKRVKSLSPKSKVGDGDPLDICIISERPINKSEIILDAKVVGGIQMIDHGEADDKIIAVLANDTVWQSATNVTDLPDVIVERLRHYFLTYKLVPGEKAKVSIDKIYDREHALKVVEAAILDYIDEYGE